LGYWRIATIHILLLRVQRSSRFVEQAPFEVLTSHRGILGYPKLSSAPTTEGHVGSSSTSLKLVATTGRQFSLGSRTITKPSDSGLGIIRPSQETHRSSAERLGDPSRTSTPAMFGSTTAGIYYRGESPLLTHPPAFVN
jgi:hypothetical protein